jgi:DNA polymerase-4/DNA polymerase V
MAWNRSYSFPRAIVHIDGDAFFASVEIARNPLLRGKPVITGKERGIVSACTYDLKARGVIRGMRLDEARKIAPDAIILPSDYETYSIFAERMYEIARRYSPMVEEYSIDECFVDLTGLRSVNHMNYRDMAHAIKRELEVELGMTFSVGLSATKVLAKIGSKWKKPDGLTAIPLNETEKFLKKVPLTGIWGIGANTGALLNKHGVYTAYDFAKKDEAWVRDRVAKPYYEIWHELNGRVVYELTTEKKTSYHSIAKTKTFTPPSRDEKFVFSQLSKNVENACIKARRWDLVSPRIFFFLKTHDFKYHGFEIRLPYPTNIPQDILREVARFFPHVFKRDMRYRATGITLTHLSRHGSKQLDLFGKVRQSEGIKLVFDSIDSISERYGKHAVFLGSSFEAMRFGAHLGERGDMPERTRTLFKGETFRRRLAIPMLGEVN